MIAGGPYLRREEIPAPAADGPVEGGEAQLRAIFGTVVELVQSLATVEASRMRRDLVRLEGLLETARAQGDLQALAGVRAQIEGLRELLGFCEERLAQLRAAMADEAGEKGDGDDAAGPDGGGEREAADGKGPD